MRHEKRPYKPKTDTQILGEGELRATIDNRHMDAAALRLERALLQYGRTKPNTPQRATMRAIVDKAAENLKSLTFETRRTQTSAQACFASVAYE